MTEKLFEEMKRYVGFGPQDEACLRDLSGRMSPHFQSIAKHFYEVITKHPNAARVFENDAQVTRLVGTMQHWLADFFEGPWDQAYFDRRLRIGRRHVVVGLDQHYMFTAMNVIRQDLIGGILDMGLSFGAQQQSVISVGRLLDMELAIMMHSYREDYLEHLRRKERLATFSELASLIGKELRNPLSVIDSSAYLLGENVEAVPGAEGHITKIHGNVDRANRIITGLLDIIRDVPSSLLPTSVDELVRRACDGLEQQRGTRVSVYNRLDQQKVLVQADQGVQILRHLLNNAADAAGAQGKIELHVSIEGSEVTFLVCDDGPGVSTSDVEHLFEPLVTTKPMGSGLGLALARKLAEANDGQLRHVEGPLSGAAFALRLPAHQ